MSSSPAPASSRLYFLDWIRIFAFMLLIFYHTGMYYVSWGWHVKSPHASTALEPLMQLSSPWRLALLFLISGAASAFMLQKLSLGAFVGQRSKRLLVPLLFGMLVIVPIQPYFEVVEKLGYTGSFAEFMKLYVHGYAGFCQDGCLKLPTWNHLWFLPYLWVYTLLLAGWMWLGGGQFGRLSALLERQLRGWKLIALPLAVLAGARILLAARFPTTHALVDDWYSHANYFSVFLLGALMAGQQGFWERVGALRWTSLAIALSCWSLMMIYNAIPDQLVPDEVLQTWNPLARTVYALCQWSAILAVCGFGHTHLQFDSPKRRYLTQAVFPVYILHQSLIVGMAHALKPAQMAPQLEGAVLIILTFSISFGVFELVRRVPLVRTLFGLGPATEDVSARKSAYAAPVPAAAESLSR